MCTSYKDRAPRVKQSSGTYIDGRTRVASGRDIWQGIERSQAEIPRRGFFFFSSQYSRAG